MSDHDLKERLDELFSASDELPVGVRIETPAPMPTTDTNVPDAAPHTTREEHVQPQASGVQAAATSEALKIAQLAIWEYDVASSTFTFNDQFYALLHTTAEREGGYQMDAARFFQKFIHPDDATRIATRIQTALENSEADSFLQEEARVTCADGEQRYGLVRFRVARDAQGNAAKLYGANQDFTERKRTEDALRASQAQLSEALQIAQLANWEYDVANDRFTFNDHFYAIFHTTAEREGGYSISSARYAERFVHPDDVAVVGVEIQRALASTDRHYIRQLDHRILYADGGVGYITVHIHIERDAQGRILRYYGANQNITERKRAEEALRISEERFRDVALSSADWVWEIDAQGRYTYCSDRVIDALGYTPSEVIGKTPFDLMAPGEAERLGPIVGEAIANKHPIKDLENRNLTKDGREVILLTNGMPLLDKDGNLLGYRGVDKDITDRMRAEAIITKRAADLATVAKVSNAATTLLNAQELLQTVADLTKEDFGLYHAHIYLLSTSGDTLTLAAGADEVGRRLVEEKHSISLDSEKSLVAKAARTRQGVIVNDVRQDPSFLPNPLLPETRAEMAIPLLVSDRVLGVLDVQSEQAGHFTDVDVDIHMVLAAQVAAALQNARLYEQAQSALEEVSALHRIMTREGWRTYRTTHEQLAHGYLFDQETVRPASPDDIAFQGRQGNGADPRHAATLADDSTVVKPLSVRDEPVGALGLYDLDGQALSPEEEALLESVSVQVAQALERARLLEQTQKRAAEIETVAQVSTVASTILDPEQLLISVVNLTKQRFDLYHCHAYILDEADQSLSLRAGAGMVGEQATAAGARIRLDAEQSLVARAARTRQPIIANDVRATPDWRPNPLLPDTQSEMAIPLLVGDRLLGVFDMQSDRRNYFTDEDVRIYGTLAAQVAVALQNAYLYAEQSATVARLRELDHLKSSFLANMSHELRTPLNSILGFTDVMLEGLDGPLTDRMDNDLQLISRNGQHLLSLINDVLDMAKIEAGKMNLNIERFNLYEVLHEVLNITGLLAREKSIELRLEDGSTDSLELQADRIRLRQVMINLVANAIKFTETGSVRVQVERDNGCVRIAVRDTGMGVRPEQAKIIFEEFGQVDTSTTRKTSGTGLGLPISKRLVEMHGGKLWVESSGVPGEGATFFIELPARDGHDRASNE